MKYKKFATLLYLLLTASFAVHGETESRSYIKSFSTSPSGSVEVTNKYGTIHVTSWNRDSVTIRAEIKVVAPGQSKIEKMFDGVHVNITESGDIVRAETSFTQNINMLFESFKGMTGKLINYESKVEINYYISVPEYISLKIENKYGDVYMENNRGGFSLNLANGSFKSGELKGRNSLSLSFCDATITAFSGGSVNASFSELTIGEIPEAVITSISSKYNITKAGSIRIDSKRDKFYISDAGSLKGDSYFTDFRINELRKETELSSRYGNINIDLIRNGFNLIDITSGYSDVTLEFEQSASYSFDIRHSNAFIVLPDKNIRSEKKTVNEEKKEYITFGTAGKSPSQGKVRIDATRGNISFR